MAIKDNKRGWIRILEATIAVMIIAAVLVVVYSNHNVKKEDTNDVISGLQKQILYDISSRNDLRYNVLASDDINPEYVLLRDYVDIRIPDVFDFSLRICNLTSPPSPCNLNSTDFVETIDKDVFVEETIVSAQFGYYNETQLTNPPIYSPKRVRLFVWSKN